MANDDWQRGESAFAPGYGVDQDMRMSAPGPYVQGQHRQTQHRTEQPFAGQPHFVQNASPAPHYAAPQQADAQSYAQQVHAQHGFGQGTPPAHQPQINSQYVHPAHQPEGYAQPAYAQPHPQHAASGLDGVSLLGGGDPRVVKLINGAGAALSLALVLGACVWGYQLAVRDVSDVPVIAALEGPMRVQPEDPGGQAADHQGLAVNAVAAEGVAEGPASTVMLAPQPEELGAEDEPARPMANSAEAEEYALEDTEPQPLPASAMRQTDLGQDGSLEAAEALAEAIAAGAAPLSGEEVELSVEEQAAARIAAIVGEDDETLSIEREAKLIVGQDVSPIPQRRPASLVTRASANPATAPVIAAERAAVSEVVATDIPKGTRLVQLGAFDSQDVARGEWDKLSGRFGEYLEGKKRVIEKAQSGGKTFYRLRAMGFEDVADARRFCSALTAGKAPCIPVVTR